MTINDDQTRPEALYRNATDKAARRSLQAAVVAGYRSRVAASVRKLVPAAHWEEGEQVGLIGVLLALEKYEPGRVGADVSDRGGAFWFFAASFVRNEIQKWADECVYWRARSRNRNDKAFGAPSLSRTAASLDAPLSGTEATLLDFVRDDAPDAEDQAASTEIKGRLDAFLATLDADDHALLICERRERVGGGVEKGNNARARRYLALVERATAFVVGSENGNGHRSAVRGNSDSVRP